MPPQIKQAKLREEWLRWYREPTREDRSDQTIADWWLTKLDQAKLETLEAIIKEVGGMPTAKYVQGNPFVDPKKETFYINKADLLTKLRDDMHPYNRDGKFGGSCIHCERVVEDGHNPDTCALCNWDKF